MSAFTRPIIGLLVGTLMGACAEEEPELSPSLMRMPQIRSALGDRPLSLTEPLYASTEDVLALSMATAHPPHRPDALALTTRCWSDSAEPAKVMTRTVKLAWTREVSIRELVPDEALFPDLQNQKLNCQLDIYLTDDSGSVNFQTDIPLRLDLTSGGVGLQFLGTPTATLHEHILDRYTLERAQNNSELEVQCEGLGSSKPWVATSHLEELISTYLNATESTPTHSDFIRCRVISRYDGGRAFSALFTLIRKYKPLTQRVQSELQESGHLLFRTTISNPNPFPGFALLQDEMLWEDLVAQFKSHLPPHKVYSRYVRNGWARWQPLADFLPVSVQLGNKLIKGYGVEIPPFSSREVQSRTDLNPALTCIFPQALSIHSIALKLKAESPVLSWKDKSLGSPLSYSHGFTVPVEFQPSSRLDGIMARACP